MTLKTLIVIVALLTPTSALAQADNNRAFISTQLAEANQWTTTWQNDPGRLCDDYMVKAASDHLGFALDRVEQVSDIYRSSRPGGVNYNFFQRILLETAPEAAKTQLRMGKALLAGGCPKQARVLFEATLQGFPGSFYEAHRDMAREGLADVRAIEARLP